ncbi:MAG: NEW3 domain-containing protein [Chloroflexi bacterium]|nr:NEW3 domain-containing protein [Chloroflexota bacterium]
MTPTRSRVSRRWLASAASAALLLLPLAAPVGAVEIVRVSTPYPAVTAAPGSNVSFEIDITTATPGRVDLDLGSVPSGWTATLRGGGFVVDAVETTSDEPASVRLDVQVPTDATAGSTRINVRATSGDSVANLPVDIKVDTEAVGDVTLTTDFPILQGSSTTTFTFNLTLSNDSAEDLTYAVNAVGPLGWETEATLTGQAQAANAIVTAGGTSNISISVTPPASAAAGDYQIAVQATAGSQTVPLELAVKITGSFSLTLTTQGGLLSGHGGAGTATTQQFLIENTGTVELTDVAVTASPPGGWEVTFDKELIASLAPNAIETVVATVTPSGEAIAGDYQITFRASNTQANDSADFRWTVETSPLGLVIGIGLIVAVGLGLMFVFQRYGRR